VSGLEVVPRRLGAGSARGPPASHPGVGVDNGAQAAGWQRHSDRLEMTSHSQLDWALDRKSSDTLTV
jgi:hypothetical protein